MDYVFPPGPEALPGVGNVLQFRRDQLAFMTGLQRSYGRAATFRLARLPVVAFFRPEAVRSCLVDNARNFTSGEFNAQLRTLLGDGLLTSDGEQHRRQRRMIQPAFHKRRVESYAQTIVEHTEELLGEWRPGDAMDLAIELQRLTLRIVAKALFNLELRAESGELGQQFTAVIENPVGLPWSWRSLPIDLPITPYGRHMRAHRTLDEFVFALIARRRAEGGDGGDVLSMLLAARDDEGLGLTDTEIRDQTMTLLAAGHETTANALSWTFYLLSKHPDARARLVEQLHDVLGGRRPEVKDLAALTYLDQVVKESMRLYPPAWTLGRRAVSDFELDGYRLPAGTVVMFSQWVIHRLTDIWGDPERFRPERFEPAAERAIPPYAYFPFGGGPRMCIGMPFANLEARLVLATVLQRYAPNVEQGHPVVPQPRITLRPRYGVRVVLDPVRTFTHVSKTW